MGCCDFSQAELDDESLLDEDEVLEDPTPALTAQVSLAPDGDQDAVNTIDNRAPKIYYVIVGFGPAAVINHTTLRGSQWGNDRIGDLTVMHIGFNNPWPNYVEHGMGQVPFLLSLPGFNRQPNVPRPNTFNVRVIDGGLHSTDFGDGIDDQYDYLSRLYHIEERRAWVAWVQHRGNPQSLPDIFDYYPENGPWSPPMPVADQAPPRPNAAANAEIWLRTGSGTQFYALIQAYVQQINGLNNWPPGADYRLIVVGLNRAREPQFETVYAAYIDFCTGSGRPNVITPPGGGTTPATRQALYAARTPPWLPPEVWDQQLQARRVLNGIDGIVSQIPWAAGERVCVTAGGGIGLNNAEKARNNNCYLDWFARGVLTGTFLNPRNHTFLLHPNGGQMAVGDLDQVAPLRPPRAQFDPHPPHALQRFGKQALLVKAHIGANNVSVTFGDRGANQLAAIVDNSQAVAITALTAAAAAAAAAAVGGAAAAVAASAAADAALVLAQQNLPLAGALIPNPNGPPGQIWPCSAAYLGGAQHPNVGNWPSDEYDRLVIPNGLNPNQLGQPAKLTAIGLLQPVILNGRGTVLENPDQRVRLLGAACQVYQTFAGPGGWQWWQPAPALPPPAPAAPAAILAAARWHHWDYHAKLPVSAVPDGFILVGSNIATANRYFVDHPNTNINTMTLAEIQALLPALQHHAAGSAVLAQVIVGCRNRANGYPNYNALRNIVNNGQAQVLQMPPPVPPRVPPRLDGPNDAAVVGLANLVPAVPLTAADQGAFMAVFQFSY